jgi:hypothetical protein
MVTSQRIYILLSVLGVVLPLSQFLPWLAVHGLDVPLLVSEITSSRIAAFGWLDVVVSACTLLFFIVVDGRESRTPHLWAPILGTLTVGVSLGLPLYLALRESRPSQARGIP